MTTTFDLIDKIHTSIIEWSQVHWNLAFVNSVCDIKTRLLMCNGGIHLQVVGPVILDQYAHTPACCLGTYVYLLGGQAQQLLDGPVAKSAVHMNIGVQLMCRGWNLIAHWLDSNLESKRIRECRFKRRDRDIVELQLEDLL